MSESTPAAEEEAVLSDTLIAGSLSGMFTRIPMHPLDTCKAKMQIHQTKVYRSTFDAFATTWRREGLRGLYAGFPTAFFGSGPASCLYFTSYEIAKRYHPFTDRSPFVAHFTAGLIAECVSCLLWVPIDVIKERLQVQSSLAEALEGKGAGSAKGSPLLYSGNLSAAATIARTEGIRGLYRGYGATVASFGPFSALYLSGHEQFKLLAQRVLDKPSQHDLPFPVHLASGAAAGAIAAFLTNPLDMAKLRIQVQRGNEAFAFGYRNILDGMIKIYQKEGPLGLFKGAGARVLSMAPSSAITMAGFEWVKETLHRRRKAKQQQAV